MSKIMVTGVTGNIGRTTVEQLLKKGVPPAQIAGLARKTDGLDDLIAKGIDVRMGDYLDYPSLVRAFAGIDKLMLTSSVAFSDRATHHFNVITAARQAGVKHIVYMSVMRKKGRDRIMPEITESDLFTEQVLRSSGLAHTIVYHPPFIDVLSLYTSDPDGSGMKLPANQGKMSPATRDELAEAHAVILTTTGHEHKHYSLGGSEAISFADIARILGEVNGQPVPFTTISEQEYINLLTAQGMPQQVAEFINSWVVAIEDGVFCEDSGDLERLLGRKPFTFRHYLEGMRVME